MDAGRVGVLAGPYETHAEALSVVEKVRAMAVKANSWAHFYSFGTSSCPEEIKAMFGKVKNETD